MTQIDYKKIAANFKNQRILVLGDFILDKYLWGKVDRISPEAPVPVVDVKKVTSCLGGAGNVCQNLRGLEAYPMAVGIIGKDQAGEWIKNNITDGRGLFSLPERPTTTKTRIIAHHQQVVRVDQEEKGPIPSSVQHKILDFIKNEKCEGMLISDYNKGIINKPLLEKILSYVLSKNLPVFIDPKVEHFDLFSPVTLITPNHFEAERIVHHPCHSDDEVERAGENILSKISAQHLIIKRGEKGMTVFEKGKEPVHIPTIAKEVFDVTGAGDTVIATASLALLAGASIQAAAFMANAAAGIVIAKLGTAILTKNELLSALPT
jgi:D-beta-D-heptose 7-phosphate kinase/D-beta-D-heptose 1-phosphate adenosyltransferase